MSANGTQPKLVAEIRIQLLDNGQVGVAFEGQEGIPDITLRGMFEVARENFLQRLKEAKQQRIVMPPPGIKGDDLRNS